MYFNKIKIITILFILFFSFGFTFGNKGNILDEQTFFEETKKIQPFFGYNTIGFKKINNIHISGRNIIIPLNDILGKSKYEYFFYKFSSGNKEIKSLANNLFNFDNKHFEKRLDNKNLEKLNKICTKFDKKFIYKPFSKYHEITLKNKGLNLKMSRNEFLDLMSCYLYKNKSTHTIEGKIVTEYARDREININIGMSTIKGFWKEGDIISIYDKTQNGEGYTTWYGLFYDYETKKHIAKKVSQGGICGVSSVFYQTTLNAYNSFEIIERHPHSMYYDKYYNFPGVDASLFGNGKTSMKDLKVKNNHGGIIIDTFTSSGNGKYIYNTRLWSIDKFNKTKFSSEDLYNGRKCINTFIFNKWGKKIKEIKSCYAGGMYF